MTGAADTGGGFLRFFVFLKAPTDFGTKLLSYADKEMDALREKTTSEAQRWVSRRKTGQQGGKVVAKLSHLHLPELCYLLLSMKFYSW